MRRIREGDHVIDRQNRKRGVVAAVLPVPADWQKAGASIIWAVVWWDGEDKPAVESIDHLRLSKYDQ